MKIQLIVVVIVLTVVASAVAQADWCVLDTDGMRVVIYDYYGSGGSQSYFAGIVPYWFLQWLPSSYGPTGWGLNAEYTINGMQVDNPTEIVEWWRKSPSHLREISQTEAGLHWSASDSPWNAEGDMVFSIGYDWLDITFQLTPN